MKAQGFSVGCALSMAYYRIAFVSSCKFELDPTPRAGSRRRLDRGFGMFYLISTMRRWMLRIVPMNRTLWEFQCTPTIFCMPPEVKLVIRTSFARTTTDMDDAAPFNYVAPDLVAFQSLTNVGH
jgi:hypothetical protein